MKSVSLLVCLKHPQTNTSLFWWTPCKVKSYCRFLYIITIHFWHAAFGHCLLHLIRKDVVLVSEPRQGLPEFQSSLSRMCGEISRPSWHSASAMFWPCEWSNWTQTNAEVIFAESFGFPSVFVHHLWAKNEIYQIYQIYVVHLGVNMRCTVYIGIHRYTP
jgi:hypothetical protein